ncbi:MAG TPA: universal stress protein [Vicinamibacterales bacterium]|nr:universal stress protein [Vicinamibacterales bacterium]
MDPADGPLGAGRPEIGDNGAHIMTLGTILCPVDFSEQSQQALRWAGALAWRYNSRLVVLTAVDPLLARAARMRLGLDLAKVETEPELRLFVRSVLPDATGAPQALIEVGVGNASEVILRAAEREAADLLVLGTHGLGGFQKVLLGSTTEQVLRRTKKPVLAVPLNLGAQAVALDAAGPRFALSRIMVATDFSEPSAMACRWAGTLAGELGGSLLLIHVVAPLAVAPRWRSHVVEVDAERVRLARERLDAVLRDQPASVEHETAVSVGRPAESISSMAAERGVALIVMGLTGQSGQAIRPGSIAYRVLTLSHVPVLVVPSYEQETGVTAQAAQ